VKDVPERDVELVELRERIMKLELKVDDLTKRLDNVQNYMKQLYTYLQQNQSKSLL
jgi:prefoldin subunit 5